jgi:hypothetical protein
MYEVKVHVINGRLFTAVTGMQTVPSLLVDVGMRSTFWERQRREPGIYLQRKAKAQYLHDS